jgi:hypothetical protein
MMPRWPHKYQRRLVGHLRLRSFLPGARPLRRGFGRGLGPKLGGQLGAGVETEVVVGACLLGSSESCDSVIRVLLEEYS